MEDRVGVIDFDDFAIWKHGLHADLEGGPFVWSPEVVEVQESATQKIIAQFGCLGGSQEPIAHLARGEPGPIVDVISIVQVDGLFDGSHIHTSQPPQGRGEVPIGARVILGPTGPTLAPIAVAAPESATAARAVGVLRIHQPGENPVGLSLVIRRERDVVIRLHAGVDAPFHLEGGQGGDEDHSARSQPPCALEHVSSLARISLRAKWKLQVVPYQFSEGRST